MEDKCGCMKLKKIFLLLVGIIALTLGAVGIILPVLPTTPFILLAAGCFSASNKRLAMLLRKHPYFGSYIENYENKVGIPRKIKIRSILFLWIGLILSMIITKVFFLQIILIMVGIGVTIHLSSLKNREDT
jgi:uncharacterized membrane protein YbaN (DUF454 family)